MRHLAPLEHLRDGWVFRPDDDTSAAHAVPASAAELVAAMKRSGSLTDARVEAAFLAVPRAAFVPPKLADRAYADEALGLFTGPDQQVTVSCSQPSMIALMLEQLDVRPGHNVLEIGTGSGYNAALLSHLVGERGRVTTVEYDQQAIRLAEANLQRVALSRVMMVQGDGAIGFAPRAAYDRIIATVGIWDIPEAWPRQLRPGGILVAPVWLEGLQFSGAFRLGRDGVLASAHNIPCSFVRLRGSNAGPPVLVEIGPGGGLSLLLGDARRIERAALNALLSDDIQAYFIGEALRAGEYWWGFGLYLALNTPPDIIFASYHVSNNQRPYGLSGSGLALIHHTSACFMPYREHGNAICFGAADSAILASELLHQWIEAGRPTASQLRLRFAPRGMAIHGQYLLSRTQHTLAIDFMRDGRS
jgi:protein-L-isoaspartate(D-aspartate) O-methyltransferase